MAEYVDRKALLESLQETEKKLSELYETAGTQDMANSCYGQRIMLIECILRIKEQPTADVAPVRHGRWEGTADGYADGGLVFDMWNCSECGFDADGAEEKPNWKFCPNCGARMDGGADNGT